MLGFAVAFLLAIQHRRDIHRHARYMAVTGLLILPPALARLAPQVLPVRGFELAFVLLMALPVLQQIGFWAGFTLQLG